MNRISIRVLTVLLTLLILFSLVACKEEVKTYVVTFDPDNGTAVEQVTVSEGQKVKKPSNPTKEGLYFGGWWTKNKKGNFKSKYSFSKQVTSDLALYARWYTTEYYMPAGWAEVVTEPVIWTSTDTGTEIVPEAVLQGDFKTATTNVTPELKAALTAAIADENYFKDVKNIIIIISDGMGIKHVQASEKWSGDLIMTRLPNVGASKTLTREGSLTDSAAGGTALATGYKTTRLFASMDAEGNNLVSMSELARDQGKLVGIVTNAELADATPAVYSIHNKNRSQGWTKMCEQQIVFGADLFMGNGNSDYAGYFNLGSDLYQFTVDNHMKLYSTAADLVSHFDDQTRLWAVFKGSSNQFARFDTTDPDLPNLQQMTAYAIAWLDNQDRKYNSEQGFVVMIENTYTDHFGHGNNPIDGSENTFGIVKEVQSTDEAVAIALKYVLEHPDTALIVTADHETGGTTLGTGWETDFTRIQAGTGDHSKQDVPVFAIGKGTEALNSLTRTEAERAAGLRWDEAEPYDNWVIGHVVGSLLGDDDFGGDISKHDNSNKKSPKFEITTDESTQNLTYTLELKGAPIKSGNYIQFKIKPVDKNDNITVSVQSKDGVTTKVVLKQTAFVNTDEEKLEFVDDYYASTPLMKAYNQAFVASSGVAEGWYQVSVPALSSGNKIVISIGSTAGIPAGSKIEMDDLTIQFASTIGEIKFISTNATATGACLVP